MPKKWNFLSNHGLVISYIAQHPSATLREIARVTDLTERAVYQIVRDLEADGFILKAKSGRRNSYELVDRKVREHAIYNSVTLAQWAESLTGVNGKPASA